MKTLREILFARHQGAAPELDAIGQRLFGGGAGAPAERRLSLVERCWQEIFWSTRRIWMGLAAAWVLMVLINVWATEPDQPEPGLARLSREEVAWLVKQNARWRAALVEPRPAPAVDSRSRPGPQSRGATASRHG